MLTNAVSSAVGRLYASAAAAAEPRMQVQRIEAVARLAASGTGAQSTDHGEREHSAQRSALTNGVRSVFELVAGVDSVGSEDDPNFAMQLDPAAAAQPAATGPADPHLEEAILRFIHAVFRSLAEAEDTGADSTEITSYADGRASRDAAATDAGHAGSAGFGIGREALSSRIEALANRLGASGDEADQLSGDRFAAAGQQAGTTTVDADGNGPTDKLAQSFAEVLQALGVKLGTAKAESGQSPTRGDLVGLMHRLAHAMQGAPPVDEGLPLKGGLLHARA